MSRGALPLEQEGFPLYAVPEAFVRGFEVKEEKRWKRNILLLQEGLNGPVSSNSWSPGIPGGL